jgi:hypothetical protein
MKKTIIGMFKNILNITGIITSINDTNVLKRAKRPGVNLLTTILLRKAFLFMFN